MTDSTNINDRNLKRGTYLVDGLDCPQEGGLIARRFNKEPGVENIEFNYLGGKMILTHALSEKRVLEILKTVGFSARLDSNSLQARGARLTPFGMVTIICGILIGAAFSFSFTQYTTASSIIYTVAGVLGLSLIARKAFIEARHFSLGINFLMFIAVVGALFIEAYSEGAIVIFLFALSQLIEGFSLTRSRRAIEALAALTPKKALLITDSGQSEALVETVKPGERILIRPGERIPLDGLVVAGVSEVDQASVTGESIPVLMEQGSEVFAGTLNQTGALTVQVTRRVDETQLSRIIHTVEEAQTRKARSEKFIDVFAGYYTPVVVAAAVICATIPPLLFDQSFALWFYRSLVLLVISCPCALVISTPVTVVSGLTNAARQGILVKGGVFLEALGKTDTVVFDKTGTLTRGRPVVDKIFVFNHYTEQDILQIAGSIERNSEHTLARAIVRRFREGGLSEMETRNFEALPGKGARAEINGDIFYIGSHRFFEELHLCNGEVHSLLEDRNNAARAHILVGNQAGVLAVITLRDEIRGQSRGAVKALREIGINRLVMVTGDHEQNSRQLSEELKLDQYHAEMMPADKARLVEQEGSGKRTVLMVGDGINDAPALSGAGIGLAMGTIGSDAALESADVALMNDDLSRIPYAIRLGRKVRAIIRQNIFLSLAFKFLILLLAIPGLATLWMAVFADTGVALIVIANGMRALTLKASSA